MEGPVWGGGLFLEELSLRCHEMWGGGEGTQWVPCPSSPSTLVGPAHSGGGLPLWLQHREPGSWWGCWPHQPSPQRRKTSWAVRVGLDSPRRQGGEQGLPMSCHPRGRAWPAVSQMPTGSQPASRLRVLWVAVGVRVSVGVWVPAWPWASGCLGASGPWMPAGRGCRAQVRVLGRGCRSGSWWQLAGASTQVPGPGTASGRGLCPAWRGRSGEAGCFWRS